MSPAATSVVGKDAQLRAHKAFMARSQSIAAEETALLSGCAVCADKDYQNPCPAGWEAKHDGTCHATASYEGLCKRTQSFLGANKREAEILCGICWPCKEAARGCERNWDAPCPRGYSSGAIPFDAFADATGLVCSMDVESDGLCEQEVSFADIAAKMEFAERCDVSWPCKTHCEQSVPSQCPEDWIPIGDGLCAAPNAYKVDGCRLLQQFRGWSAPMKSVFADKCKVVWPCDTQSIEEEQSDGAISQASCVDLDLAAGSCPRSWVSRDDGLCEAPPDLQGPCSSPKDFRRMSAEQKILWASECFVDWKCVGEYTMEHRSRAYSVVEINSDESGPISSAGLIVSLDQ